MAAGHYDVVHAYNFLVQAAQIYRHLTIRRMDNGFNQRRQWNGENTPETLQTAKPKNHH